MHGLTTLDWVKAHVPSNNVVVSWWDYGFWLTYLGNCTTLNDNTTENTTQIENVGFIYHGQRNPSNAMLSTYNNKDDPGRVNYILVFTTLQISNQAAAPHHTLQSQLDMEMKENGFGWQEFQVALKIG